MRIKLYYKCSYWKKIVKIIYHCCIIFNNYEKYLDKTLNYQKEEGI